MIINIKETIKDTGFFWLESPIALKTKRTHIITMRIFQTAPKSLCMVAAWLPKFEIMAGMDWLMDVEKPEPEIGAIKPT
ncbi:MAG: hypothetical protein LBH85_09695 [Treponema sp.]|jgi:hypothetical protein|nr:hypothetical protein [Treponema sp.]